MAEHSRREPLTARVQRVEKIAAEIYRRLAARFPGTEEGKLFAALAEEEEQHSLRFDLLHQLDRSGKKLALESEMIDALLAEGELLLGVTALEAPPLRLPEAIALVAKLEQHFADSHAEMASRNADPAVRAVFEKLAKQDRAHQSLLTRLVR